MAADDAWVQGLDTRLAGWYRVRRLVEAAAASRDEVLTATTRQWEAATRDAHRELVTYCASAPTTGPTAETREDLAARVLALARRLQGLVWHAETVGSADPMAYTDRDEYEADRDEGLRLLEDELAAIADALRAP